MRAIAEKTRLPAAVITVLFALSLVAEAHRSIPIAAARAQAQGTTVTGTPVMIALTNPC